MNSEYSSIVLNDGDCHRNRPKRKFHQNVYSTNRTLDSVIQNLQKTDETQVCS